MMGLGFILIFCISTLCALEDDLIELNLSHKGQAPSKARITNIDYIVRFLHLQRLNLEDCRRLGDNCRVVAQVTTLTDLNLACVGITSIAFLAPLVNLTCLDLSANSRLQSLEGLNLPNLRELKLRGNYHMRDFRPLQNLTSLVKLNLNCIFNVVEDHIANRLDFLTCLHSLRKLDIGCNDYFYNIEFLLKMFSLRSLSIHSSKSICYATIKNAGRIDSCKKDTFAGTVDSPKRIL